VAVLTRIRVLWRRRALERSCGWSRAELHRNQQERLAALRRFAIQRSPFYRQFHRGLERRPLCDLPILTKPLLMEHFDELVTDRQIRLADAEAYLREVGTDTLFRSRYVVLSTSGSTGRRGVFLFDGDEWMTAIASIARPIAWAQLGRTRRRTAMVASTTPWHYSARIGASLTSRLMPSLRLDAAEPLERIIARLNAWQPDVLAAYPSVLRQLADAQLAGDLRIRLRSVATSAEVLTTDVRSRVRRAWGVRVFDTYGATEYAPIAAECEAGRKHLFEDNAIIEIVDERGRAVAPGQQGERLLLTIFNRRTQPLIRYEISDMVRPIDVDCECGRPFAAIESIEGRLEDVLHFPRRDGASGEIAIHPNIFHELLENVPASGWQVRQDGTRLRVSLTGASDPSVYNGLESRVRDALSVRGAHVESVHVAPVDTLERGATGKAPLIARSGKVEEAARVS
jgi:putative adenylate-forming enzyme